jgi:hypothetical protein
VTDAVEIARRPLQWKALKDNKEPSARQVQERVQ